MADEFPIGGPRQAVYDALKSRQFKMSGFSDKWWKRPDGLEVCVYGSGSKLWVRSNGAQVIDGPMADVLKIIDSDWTPAAAK